MHASLKAFPIPLTKLVWMCPESLLQFSGVGAANFLKQGGDSYSGSEVQGQHQYSRA